MSIEKLNLYSEPEIPSAAEPEEPSAERETPLVEPEESSAEREIPSVEYAESLSDEEILARKYDSAKLDRQPDEFELDSSKYTRFKLQTVAKVEQNQGEKKRLRDGESSQKLRQANLEETASIMLGSVQKVIYGIDSLDQEKCPFPDEIIYLDKSGRPVSWLVNTFWEDFALKDENGQVKERPKHSYVNIDRGLILQSFFGMTVMDGAIKYDDDYYSNHYDAWMACRDKLNDEHLSQLRALFLEGDVENPDELTPEQIMKMPARLDNKNILIIDEVSSNHKTTLEMAETLFSKAFPGCNVRSMTFWPESASRSVPVWYHKTDVEGRGIGDVEPEFYEDLLKQYSNPGYFRDLGVPEDQIEQVQAKAVKKVKMQLLGKRLLSSRVNLAIERQNMTRELMSDFRQLHEDYLAHKVLPSGGSKDASPLDKKRFAIEIVRQGVNPLKLRELDEKVFSKDNPEYPRKDPRFARGSA
ncbi:hypothetical protein J5491_02000 [Candidatus Saccharibacteria bacterium]|nr:hypothetical protein [Candidatus Saccharibacteria bacterium]